MRGVVDIPSNRSVASEDCTADKGRKKKQHSPYAGITLVRFKRVFLSLHQSSMAGETGQAPLVLITISL